MYQNNGRNHRKFGKKPVILLVALALIVGIAAGGTLAWLTSSTNAVENVFTPSDVQIALTESDDLDLQMIPGYTITKDPKVTVTANSEKCYVFVKLEKSTNYGTFLEDYVIATGWEKLDNVDGVYYRIVDQKDEAQDFYVLSNNQVTVKSTVTKADMESIKTSGQPTLTLTAYACQYYKNNTPGTGANQDSTGTYFEPSEAWSNCPGA